MRLFKIFLITFICCASPAVYGLDIESTYPANKAIGVPVDIIITVTFNAPLADPEYWLGTSPSQYITIEKIKDKNGDTRDPSISIPVGWPGITLSSTNKTLNIEPSTSLDNGPTFKVTLKTLIKDTSGDPLTSSYSFTFSTTWDSSANNTIVGADGKVKLYAPFNTLPADGYIEIIEDPLNNTVISTPANIQSANSAIIDASDPLRYPLTSTMKEFNLYIVSLSSSTPYTDTLSPNAAGELPQVTLSYQDTDNDGLIDGTSPQVLEANVSIYRLNIQSNTWEKIGGVIDTQNNIITAQTNKLTVFVLMGGVYQDLNQAYGYPVPFTPNKDPSHTHITFTRLKPESTIKIYTIAGELVRELRADSIGSNVRWDTRNDSGKKVASGLYLYRISTSSTDKSGKLVILR